MNWDRVNSARGRGKALLLFAGLLVVSPIFLFVAAPRGPSPMFGPTLVLTTTGIESSRGATGIPIDILPLAVGLFGLLIGLAWMWRLYRAPTKYDGAHWRYRDR